MATLRAHGNELARRETPTGRIVVMSDGNILRNQYGLGWKTWRKLKPGVDPTEYARKFDQRTQALPAEVRAYIQALEACCSLEHRWQLHSAIALMHNDPDGVLSQMEDCSGAHCDYSDIAHACRSFEIAAEICLKEAR